MRVRVGDVVLVRLAQDPKVEYMGAVTGLSRRGSRSFVWEMDSQDRGVIGMRLEFHSDDERMVTIPRDTITRVMSPSEWREDERALRFVAHQQKSLQRLCESHYGEEDPPWAKETVAPTTNVINEEER